MPATKSPSEMQADADAALKESRMPEALPTGEPMSRIHGRIEQLGSYVEPEPGTATVQDVDASKSPFDYGDAKGRDTAGRQVMRSGNSNPVTLDEAQKKATAFADQGGPDGKLSPRMRDSFIEQWTQMFVDMPRSEFKQWEQENLTGIVSKQPA